MTNLILVPLDGSAFGEQAIPAAIRIAERERGSLELVHVFEWLPPHLTQGAPPLDPALDLELQHDRESYLESVARWLGEQTTAPVTTALLNGPVTDSLVAHVEARAPHIVVMATHGRGGLSRLWVGGVATDLVRRSPAPVLLVKPTAQGTRLDPSRRFERVLVPLDGSPWAEEAVEHAISLAHDAELVLLHVVTPVFYVAPDAEPYPTDDLNAEEAYLTEVAGRLRGRGLVTEARVVTHPQPAQAILECAADVRADLIAMETHGRTGVSRLLLGSVSDKVLRASPVPVLMHRPHASTGSETSGRRARSGAVGR